MEQQTIHCLSCDQGWTLPAVVSEYEQQSLESCPCPFCGAYTLCAEIEETHVGRRPMLAR